MQVRVPMLLCQMRPAGAHVATVTLQYLTFTATLVYGRPSGQLECMRAHRRLNGGVTPPSTSLRAVSVSLSRCTAHAITPSCMPEQKRPVHTSATVTRPAWRGAGYTVRSPLQVDPQGPWHRDLCQGPASSADAHTWFTPLACGPGSPELSKSYMDMACKLFTFTFTRARAVAVSMHLSMAGWSVTTRLCMRCWSGDQQVASGHVCASSHACASAMCVLSCMRVPPPAMCVLDHRAR